MHWFELCMFILWGVVLTIAGLFIAAWLRASRDVDFEADRARILAELLREHEV